MSRKRQIKTKKAFPWLPVALGALAVVVIILAVSAFQPQAGGAAEALPREVSVDEAHDLQAQGAFMLDVRELEEWEQFHMPGATLIPLGELESRLSEVPQEQAVVVVCRSGNRSASGRDILLQAGYQNVTSMAGGMNQWASAGYPTVSGP
ncbi:MAG: rhodanese-like domain-containing protein [Anaerolineae bacterium]|nr:rhodanese-like domain-containing protein [Anaerolineae bacterium]